MTNELVHGVWAAVACFIVLVVGVVAYNMHANALMMTNGYEEKVVPSTYKTIWAKSRPCGCPAD